MSITSIFDFGSSSSFNLSQALIDIGIGKIGYQDTELFFLEDFADDTGFSYDNTKAEFISGLVRQKDLRPAQAVLAATYNITKDLSWINSGSVSATEVGTTNIASGKLQCIGEANNGVSYTSNEIGNIGNTGAIKLRFAPDYSGTPLNNTNIFEFRAPSGNNDRMVLFHGSTGFLRFTAYSSVGTVIHSAANIGGAAWVPVAGQEYEFELNFDTVGAAVRVFIDGVLKGGAPVTSYNRGSSATVLMIGAGSVYPVSDGSYNDLIVFSEVQHTSNYTPGYSVNEYIYDSNKVDLPTHTHSVPGQDISSITSFVATETGSPKYIIEGKYWNGTAWVTSDGSYSQASSSATVHSNAASIGFLTGDNTIDVSVVFPNSNTLSSVDNLSVGHMAGVHFLSGSIETATALSIQSIASFSASISEPTNTTLRFQLRIDGTLQYWNGTAWVTSDGSTSQGNTAAQINSNVGSLSLGQNSSVKIRIALATTDETVSPSIDSMTIVYDFGGVLDVPETCIIWGYYLDVSGQGVSGASITFQLKRSNRKEYKEANSNIIEKKVTVTTDANGYFESPLIRSSEFQGSGIYLLSIEKTSDSLNTSKTSQDISIEFTVPDAVDKNITDLITAA